MCGFGVSQDFHKAMEYYLKAVDHDSKAQNMIGNLSLFIW